MLCQDIPGRIDGATDHEGEQPLLRDCGSADEHARSGGADRAQCRTELCLCVNTLLLH